VGVGLVVGETAYLRHVQRHQFGGLFPLRVAVDRPDGVLLWAPAGTTYWHFDMPDGRTLTQTSLPEWSAAHRMPVARSVPHGVLSWHPHGRDFSVRWFFDVEGRFYAWYANLEAPAVVWRRRGVAYLDTVDWDLDIWVQPDRSWTWKDEDIFVERLAQADVYWVDDEPRVRRAGAAVVALIEAGAFPFDGTWCDFRPDPAWPAIPTELPDGWHMLDRAMLR
jgi:hypothetical protein